MDATEKRDLLKAYRQKRNQDRTPEPDGAQVRVRSQAAHFVVQQHAARALHFDFRLSHSGVLLSWAVPKGPSPNPADKRLAVRTEDHPLDYADFEGVIPAGNYGAGAVIQWDAGRYLSLLDMERGLEQGKLLFELHGAKLRGRWTLVKTRRSAADWLLIKERDAAVREQPDYSPRSVASGLTVEQLARGHDPLPALRRRLLRTGLTAGAAPDPSGIPLMLAQSSEPFDRNGWWFEIKYDGYRALACRTGDETRLLSRNGHDLGGRFPEIVRALDRLPFARFTMDAEIVVRNARGLPDFSLLQQRGQLSRAIDAISAAARAPATLYVFDLLSVDDFDLRSTALRQRKRWLQDLLPPGGTLQFVEHIASRGRRMFEQAVAMGLEGVIGKDPAAPYRGGRSAAWRKVRALRSDDFAVVGWTPQRGTASRLGSLLLAQHDGAGWVYCGRAGSGLSDAERNALLAAMANADVMPALVSRAPAAAQWCQPCAVVEVSYADVTASGHLRHPVLLRWREDKSPQACTRLPENPLPLVGAGGGDEQADVVATNRDKVFWPELGLTKGDLLDYYDAIAPWLLPLLADRPLVLSRYPDGIHGKHFFQKDAPVHAPDWLRLETIYSEGGERDIRYLIADDAASLRYIANLGAIPLHVWASRVTQPGQPDWSILDLDPKGAPFADVVKVARAAKTLCDEIDLPAFIKTSGASGLHVLVPLAGRCTFEQARTLAELLARVLVQRLPDIATVARALGAREGKVYVDYLQNGRGKLLASAYCPRALPAASVSMPLHWRELTPALSNDRFTLKNAVRRVRAWRDDPFAGLLSAEPDLVAALSALQRSLTG